MTVQSQLMKVTANGNGSATSFSFSPLILPDESSQIQVTKVVVATGVETLLVEGAGAAQYTVVVAAYPGTGSITYPSTGATRLATGESVIMKRVLTLEQQTALENQGGYYPKTQEAQFDRFVMIALQQQEELDRCAKLAISDTTTDVDDFTADILTLGAIAAAVSTVAGISANVTTVAGISANVTTVAGISANVTTVAGVSAAVTTVAGISANVTAVAASVYKYLFDTSTSMADPGSGDVRFNNATPASVTQLAISNTFSGGSDISDFIVTWDDSSNTALRGTLTFRNSVDATQFLVFSINGAITDNGAWLQIPVAHVSGSTLPASADGLFLGFVRTGDTGTGDMTSTGSTMTGDLTMSGSSVVETEGAAVASATTTNIWATDGNTVHITGTTTITSFGTAPQAGAWMKVVFDGILTLTHSANLNLPGAANITTAADDFAFVYADSATQFDVLYFKATGAPVNQGQGTDIASAGTINLDTATGDTVDVTGTTTITAVTLSQGRVRRVRFTGALTFTHGASLVLPNNGLNIVTAAGDTAVLVGYAAGVVRCHSYQRLDGRELAVGNIPQNSQSAAYTTVLADAGKHILHPTADNNARTFTIDSNANVPYPIGTAITFVNQINTVTIAITSDTMTLYSAGTTGSRTLAANGLATALKVSATGWVITGVGLT